MNNLKIYVDYADYSVPSSKINLTIEAVCGYLNLDILDTFMNSVIMYLLRDLILADGWHH